MCQCHAREGCFGCRQAMSRRGFLQGCGVAAAGGLVATNTLAQAPQGEKVRVGLVFISR